MFAGYRFCRLALMLAGAVGVGSCGYKPDAPAATNSETANESRPASSGNDLSVAIPSSTEFSPIPLDPAGTFAPNYPSVGPGYEPQADAPFSASVFLATNRLTIVDGGLSFVITGGQRGADGLTEEFGAIYVVVLDAESGEKRSEQIIDVPDCPGAISISSDTKSPSRAVGIDCIDRDTRKSIWSGIYDATDGSLNR